jgi:hypothetical protein
MKGSRRPWETGESAGPAKAVLRDREVSAWLAPARADDMRVITSAAAFI